MTTVIPRPNISALWDLLDLTVERGFQDELRPPFVICVMDPNGNAVVARYDGEQHLGQAVFDILANTSPSPKHTPSITAPMTIVLIDQDNRSFRLEVDKDGKTH